MPQTRAPTRPSTSRSATRSTSSKKAYVRRLPVLLKGPTGCGKTRFVEYMATRLLRGARRATRAVADHRRVPRGPHRLGPRRPLPDPGLRHGVDRRSAPRRPFRAPVPFATSTRSSRARKDTIVLIHPLTGPPPHPADRQARRDAGSARRLPARDLVQPRLPERAEGPEVTRRGSASSEPRVRLPAARPRGRDHPATRAASTSRRRCCSRRSARRSARCAARASARA